MTVEFVGKCVKSEKKEYDKKEYFKNTMKEIDTGRFISLSSEVPMEVDEWYDVKGSLYFSEFKGKTYLSVKKVETLNQFSDIPF